MEKQNRLAMVSGEVFLGQEEAGLVVIDGASLPKLQEVLSQAQERGESLSVELEGEAVLISSLAFFYDLPLKGSLRKDIRRLEGKKEGGVVALSRSPLDLLEALREAAHSSVGIESWEVGDTLSYYFGVVTPAGYLLAVFHPYHWEIPPVVAPIPIGQNAAPSEPLSLEAEGVR